MRHYRVLLSLLLLASVLLLLGVRAWLFPPPEIPEPQVQVEEVLSKEISAAEGGRIVVTKEMSPWSAGTKLIIPAGALAADTVISIGDIIDGLPSLPEGYISIGSPIYLGARGVEVLSPSVQAQKNQ